MTEQTENTEVHLSIAIAENEHGINVQFRDGVQVIPPHIIAALGGPSELEPMLPSLKDVSYEEFMQGFYSVMTSRKVNEFQAQFVANHFAPRFF